MANSKLVITGFIAAIGISGCATTPITNGTEYRSAVEAANNKQVIATEAVKGAPMLDPAMSAAAIERYLNDKVKEAEESGGFRPEG